MINLEVWVPPEFDTVAILDTHHVRDCGTIAPPVRFGWFIPLIKQDAITPSSSQDIHWSFFKNPTYVSLYDILEPNDLRLLYKNSLVNSNKEL